jgi:hypothetical protein
MNEFEENEQLLRVVIKVGLAYVAVCAVTIGLLIFAAAYMLLK